jgi:NADPH:quinone reductase-like Zn-dependent oxidoreductase
MKALFFDRTGSLEVLGLRDRPVPVPSEGEVLVAIHAAGLNPSDIKNVLGVFPYTTLPRIPGRDFAGVAEKGPPHLVGRRVWGTGMPLGFTADGAHAEYLVLAADGLALMPDCLSFEQAASCGVPYATAWDGLVRAKAGKGTRLLVIGANGGVGHAAVALGRSLGADVLAAVRRPEQAGVLEVEGYRTALLAGPAELAGTVGACFNAAADVIFDTTGNWLAPAVSALANNGYLIVISPPSNQQVHVDFPVLDFYRRGSTLIGVNTLLHDTTASAAMLSEFAKRFDAGLLPPPPSARAIPLSEGAEAYRLVNDGLSGKIVLTM